MSYYSVFAVLFLLVNLHLLRNISPVFLLLPAVCYLALAFPALKTRFKENDLLSKYYMGFFWWSLYVAAVSFLNLSIAEAMAANGRFFFVFPMAMLAFAFVRTERQIRFLLLLFIGVCFVGCLTIPLQFAIGPVSWFAESSTRSGFQRYASLFGNLTAVGIVGAIGMVATMLIDLSRPLKLVVSLVILSGMLLSLQKAAILNLGIVLLLYLLLSPASRSVKVRQVAALIGLAVVALLLLRVFVGEAVFVGIDAVFRINDALARDDFTVGVSVAQRLWEFPLIMIEKYGVTGLLFGVGLQGGGGTFGIDAPQSHNSLFDLLFMGGVPYLVMFLMLMGELVRQILILRATVISRVMRNNIEVLLAIVLIFLINLPFMTGAIFQPNIASIVWTTTGIIGGLYCRQLRLTAENVSSASW